MTMIGAGSASPAAGYSQAAQASAPDENSEVLTTVAHRCRSLLSDAGHEPPTVPHPMPDRWRVPDPAQHAKRVVSPTAAACSASGSANDDEAVEGWHAERAVPTAA